jgi:ABC-type cobalamin/Fe3+-siderophores transport system ATPase subunit
MKDGRFVAVGPASEVMTVAALTAAYDVDVTVLSPPFTS